MDSIYREDFEDEGFLFINYIKLNKDQLLEVLEARNHPDIRCRMLHTEPIDVSTHLRFVESLKNRKDQIHWAVFNNHEYIGSVNLNPYDNERHEGEMGMFVVPKFLNSGIGLEMTYVFHKIAFEQMGIQTIFGRIKEDNKAVRALSKKLGTHEYKYADGLAYTILPVNNWKLVPNSLQAFKHSLFKKR